MTSDGFDTLKCQLSCVNCFQEILFWSARSVRVVYRIVDKSILDTSYLIFYWLRHGSSVRDPSLFMSEATPQATEHQSYQAYYCPTSILIYIKTK